MTKDELIQWFALLQQVKNGWHMSEGDKKDLIRLNHLVMESANNIHIKNMLGSL